MQKFTFIVMMSVLFAVYSNAREVEHAEIQQGSYHIQVGAFGSEANVNNTKQKLHAFDLYIEPYKGLNRVIVVNIMTKEQLKHTFVKIKKLYPKAFITKRPITSIKSKKVTHEATFKEPVKNYKQLFEVSPVKREIIQQHNNTLNSNTILKTRKSFL